MKTIYKILIAFLAISLMIGIASANVIEWGSFDVASYESVNFDAPNCVDCTPSEHAYNKGTLTIPINNANSNAIRAWEYEDIEIT